MNKPNVWAFFYGSFINPDVLRQSGYELGIFEVARLSGFDIHIRPTATLVRSDQHCVYGIAASVTHEQLQQLYSPGWLASYRPEPVLLETVHGTFRAAFCYIAVPTEDRQATSDYIDRIVGPAQQYGFPDWYIARLDNFRPKVTANGK